jgi:CubicO group peptidase (beta-lactamase class C family)
MPDSTTIPLKDKEVLDLLKKQDSTYFPPGSKYRYSNSGYALLALIVEAVSHQSFAEFLKKNIFDPLQMEGTVAFEKGISTVRNRAYGYTQRENRFEFTDQSLTSSVLGDGGIYSSVEDLYKWDQALYTTKLVSKATLEQAFTSDVLSNGDSTGYGFGWRVSFYKGVQKIAHSGSTVGFRTEIARYPDKRFTVIVLINRNDANPAEIASKIADIISFENQ